MMAGTANHGNDYCKWLTQIPYDTAIQPTNSGTVSRKVRQPPPGSLWAPRTYAFGIMTCTVSPRSLRGPHGQTAVSPRSVRSVRGQSAVRPRPLRSDRGQSAVRAKTVTVTGGQSAVTPRSVRGAYGPFPVRPVDRGQTAVGAEWSLYK